ARAADPASNAKWVDRAMVGIAWASRCPCGGRRPRRAKPPRSGDLGRASFFLHDLIEGLTVFYHAKFAPRALLDRIEARFEIAHIGLQGCVALGKLGVLPSLFFDYGAQAPHFEHTALPPPQLVLGKQQQNDQNTKQPAHTSAVLMPRLIARP